MLVFSALVLIVAYILIAWEKFPKVTVAMAAASILLIVSREPAEKVFAHIDFKVIFLLIGMMIIVNISKRSGMFNWAAIEMIKHTSGRPWMILFALSFFTAFLSAFLNSVTTVVLVLPITWIISKELKLNPVPFLITEIIASNIGGTATLVGDPPNIIIGSASGLMFMDFARELTPIVILIWLVTTAMLCYMFRTELKTDPKKMEKIAALDNSRTITNKRLMIKSLVVLGLVITGFLLQQFLHLEVYAIALAGASVMLFFDSPRQVMHEVEWTSIFFFIGLFVVIGVFAEAGGIKFLADMVLRLTSGNELSAAMLILWASGFLSAFIDNIPYAATMAPMIKVLGASMNVHPLWWALSLGACIGGNATIIGAASNVIVSEAAAGNGTPINFIEYLKYGVITTVVALLISSLYLYFRFFL